MEEELLEFDEAYQPTSPSYSPTSPSYDPPPDEEFSDESPVYSGGAEDFVAAAEEGGRPLNADQEEDPSRYAVVEQSSDEEEESTNARERAQQQFMITRARSEARYLQVTIDSFESRPSISAKIPETDERECQTDPVSETSLYETIIACNFALTQAENKVIADQKVIECENKVFANILKKESDSATEEFENCREEYSMAITRVEKRKAERDELVSKRQACDAAFKKKIEGVVEDATLALYGGEDSAVHDGSVAACMICHEPMINPIGTACASSCGHRLCACCAEKIRERATGYVDWQNRCPSCKRRCESWIPVR